jgi:putative SOS response-associated peptidase YedK
MGDANALPDAPTQQVSAVAVRRGERLHRPLQWGLVPNWADPSIGKRLINARAETVGEKPAFQAAYRSRRCLVVADGFYEWQRQEEGPKQPYYFHLKGGVPFGFAGLWERWRHPGGGHIQSCVIITTEANQLVAPIHHRMPVILDAADYEAWLDPDYFDPGHLQSLLRPLGAEAMTGYAIATTVNNPANDSPDCIKPLEESTAE